MDHNKLEKLLNIITDLSAEISVSADEGDLIRIKEQLLVLQSYLDTYMEDNQLRQVTEEDSDYEKYMSEAYASVSNKHKLF